MGSHSSSEQDLTKNKSNHPKSSGPFEMMHLSQNSFSNDLDKTKDMMTDSRSISCGSTTNDKTTEPKSESQSPESKVPTLFQWNEEGECVFITGSFCGWSQQFAMNKTDKGNYELLLHLPKGLYQYKFIIDGVWRLSQFHPLMTDNISNTNNFIDNTQYSIKSKGEAKSPTHKVPMNYTSEVLPNKNQLNTDAPVIPYQYSQLVNLNNNTNQPFIGNAVYINRKVIYTTNDTPSIAITNPSHIVLNHLFTKIKRKKRYIKYCGIMRVRAKFASFIYIKPMISSK